MAWVWTAIGVPGLLAGLVAWAMAAFVYFARPDRLQNRLLALVFFVEGGIIGCGTGLMYLTDVASETRAWQIVSILFMLAAPFVYVLFLSTLETPLARSLKPRGVRRTVGIAALLSPLLYYADPAGFVDGTFAWDYAPWQAATGPWFTLMILVNGLVLVAALPFIVSAYRHAPHGSVARDKQRAFLTAFLLRDGLFGFLLTSYGLGIQYTDGLDGIVLPALTTLVYMPVLAYGILRTQLFDIDLKIKWTLDRSTLAGIFIVAFLVVQETIEALLAIDGTIPGLAAAVLLGVAFRPLDRFTSRLADLVMPSVAATPEYLTDRKLAVYRAALEGAFEDGAVSLRERSILDRLREELGITAQAAAALETSLARPGEV